MEDVYIIDGVRTPVGDFLGSLKDVSAKDLAKTVMAEVKERTQLDVHIIDEIIAGCAAQPTNSPNIGRTAALDLGFPKEIPGYVVNRNCASGMQAVVNSFQGIRAGDADVNLVVGTENMSQIPYIMRGAREGYGMRHQTIIDSLWEMLEDPNVHLMMGQTAEVIARETGITREQQDVFAMMSHQRACDARGKGIFDREIVPVIIRDKKGKEQLVTTDDGPDATLTLDRLAKMRPAFEKDGTVTPGNACGLNDAAAAMVLMSERKVKELDYKPRARILSYAFAGLEPERMGLGPVYAVPKALDKAGLTLEDIDLFELNEAFAAQSLACINLLSLDLKKVNIHGGAIAIGHPVGATGVRLILALMNALETTQQRYGVATLCIGGGMGGAVVIENLNL
ncbi:MAG: thiolase family protein [Bacillaceae bacterium]|nr:thiolase family protein [Bacillaceae bacterium]